MDSKEILGRFTTDLETIRRSEGLDGTLRWTGEQLAAASDRLARALRAPKSDTDSGGVQARAAELLVIAYPHVSALSAADMDAEAFATLNMALLTVLQARVNPESFAELWLQNLQALSLHAARLIETAPPAASNTVADIVAHTYGLFIATAHHFIPRFGCSDRMRRFYDHMRHMAAHAGEDISHFQGHRIAPTLAIDILADNASRLATVTG